MLLINFHLEDQALNIPVYSDSGLNFCIRLYFNDVLEKHIFFYSNHDLFL